MKMEIKTGEIQVEKVEIVNSQYEEHTSIDTCNAELVGEKIVEDEPRRQRWLFTFRPTKYPALVIESHDTYSEEDGWNEYFYIYVWIGDKWVEVKV